MLTEDFLSKVVLGYNMKTITYPPIDSIKLSGVKKLNFYVVDSNFKTVSEQTDVPVNVWKKTYNDIYNTHFQTKHNLSRYIIITDCNNNLKYCSKISKNV